MKKGTILEDTFEKIAEHGGKAGKTITQSIKQTVSPTKMWEQLLGISSSKEDNGLEKLKSEQQKNKNHTPLNLDKLHTKYQDNEKQKLEKLRFHLFRLVKQGEEKTMYEKQKEEQEKKQKLLFEAEEKKKKDEEKKKKEQTQELPKGKVRRSIFSAKKVAERQHAETKPATGKQ